MAFEGNQGACFAYPVPPPLINIFIGVDKYIFSGYHRNVLTFLIKEGLQGNLGSLH